MVQSSQPKVRSLIRAQNLKPMMKKHMAKIAQYTQKTVGPLSRSPSGGGGPSRASMMRDAEVENNSRR